MRGCRSAEQDYLEPGAATNQLRQLASRRDVGNMPSPRLLGERQFEAFTAQRARIDYREVAPDRVDIPVARAARQVRFSFAEVVQSVQFAPLAATAAGENEALATQ